MLKVLVKDATGDASVVEVTSEEVAMAEEAKVDVEVVAVGG